MNTGLQLIKQTNPFNYVDIAVSYFFHKKLPLGEPVDYVAKILLQGLNKYVYNGHQVVTLHLSYFMEYPLIN